jgi:hypothetical protein
MNSQLAPSVTVIIVIHVYGARVCLFFISRSKASKEQVVHLLIKITNNSLQFVLLWKNLTDFFDTDNLNFILSQFYGEWL